MESFREMIPPHTAITWNDFYRFCGNNFIGRKKREAVMRAWPKDAGKALATMVDEIGKDYVPANMYIIWSEFDIPPESYRPYVAEVAKAVTEQRNTPKEPYDYWKFVYDNCYTLLKDVINDGRAT